MLFTGFLKDFLLLLGRATGGKGGFAFAYSGVGDSMAIEGGRWLWVLLTAVMVFYDHRRVKRFFVLAYSGFVGTMPIVGVSFRTGLRG